MLVGGAEKKQHGNIQVLEVATRKTQQQGLTKEARPSAVATICSVTYCIIFYPQGVFHCLCLSECVISAALESNGKNKSANTYQRYIDHPFGEKKSREDWE